MTNNKALLLPPIGTEAVFSFRSPFDVYIKNILGKEEAEIKLEVNSIASMKDYIKLSHRDPFTDIYNPVGLSELIYKEDLKNEVPIVTFLYRDDFNMERLFRVPFSYVENCSNQSTVEYSNRGIYLSLPPLPVNLSIDATFPDIVDLIEDKLGVTVNISEVSTGEVTSVSLEEHKVREKIRRKTGSVYKSNYTLRKEAEVELTAIKERLDELGIVLGGKNAGIK